jgi:hypothetical protein
VLLPDIKHYDVCHFTAQGDIKADSAKLLGLLEMGALESSALGLYPNSNAFPCSRHEGNRQHHTSYTSHWFECPTIGVSPQCPLFFLEKHCGIPDNKGFFLR